MASIFKSLKTLDLLKHSQCFMNTDNMQYLAWWNMIVSSFHSHKLLLNTAHFLQRSMTHFSPAWIFLRPSSSDTLKLVQVNTGTKNTSNSSCTFSPPAVLSFSVAQAPQWPCAKQLPTFPNCPFFSCLHSSSTHCTFASRKKCLQEAKARNKALVTL